MKLDNWISLDRSDLCIFIIQKYRNTYMIIYFNTEFHNHNYSKNHLKAAYFGVGSM